MLFFWAETVAYFLQNLIVKSIEYAKKNNIATWCVVCLSLEGCEQNDCIKSFI